MQYYFELLVTACTRSPRAMSPIEPSRENFETTFDLEGNVETVSTASGAREDSRSLGSSSENRFVVASFAFFLILTTSKLSAERVN